MHVNSIRLAVLAVSAMTAVGLAQAGTSDVDYLKLGPKQQAQYVKQTQRQQAVSPTYNYDIKPAQIKKASVGGKVDASRKFAQAVVTLVATDNLSGVNDVYVTLVSPSGQQTASANWSSPFASKRSDLELAVDMDNATENGTWRIYSMQVRDSNSYGTYYDEAAVAAMGGHTTFEVVGAVGDQTAPTAVVGGINLTPTVSKSTPPGGMLPGAEARVGAQLKLADVGSGIRSATLTYCLNGELWTDCFYVQGGNTVRGKTDQALTLGGHISTWNTIGTYLPVTLDITDHAGNSTYLATYQGDDLNSLLDNPAIAVTQ